MAFVLRGRWGEEGTFIYYERKRASIGHYAKQKGPLSLSLLVLRHLRTGRLAALVVVFPACGRGGVDDCDVIKVKRLEKIKVKD